MKGTQDDEDRRSSCRLADAWVLEGTLHPEQLEVSTRTLLPRGDHGMGRMD